MAVSSPEQENSKLMEYSEHSRRKEVLGWFKPPEGTGTYAAYFTPLNTSLEYGGQESNTSTVIGSYYSSLLPKEEMEGKKSVAEIPTLEGINSSNAALTYRVRKLVSNFWAIVMSNALQAGFPVEKTKMDIFRDDVEDRTQVVLRVFTSASALQSMAFWDSLEEHVQEWLVRLPQYDRSTFLHNISLRLHWRPVVQ